MENRVVLEVKTNVTTSPEGGLVDSIEVHNKLY